MDTYNKKTMKTLGNILAPDCPEKYQSVFAESLKSVIIPWTKMDDEIQFPDLIKYVKNAVVKSFETYCGSHRGYMLHETNRRLLYSVLWGSDAGLSLANTDFLDKEITCEYNDEARAFTISLLPSGRPIAYSDRQLKWCRENAPKDKQNWSDNDIVEMMFPAWLEFGDFNTSLPKPIPTSDENKEFIAKLWRGEKD